VAVYLKKPPEVWTTIGDVRQWVVEWLAGAMFVNRLSEYSQRVDSPILDISSFQGRFIRSLSAFVLNARIPDGWTIEGVSTIMQEFERAARHGFTRSELEREKREKLRALEQRYAEVEKTSSSSYAAVYVSFFLQDGLILGSEREKALYLELVPDITLREVNAKAREWTRPANRMILVSAPEHKDVDLPTSEELVAVVTVATRGRVAPYRDAVSDAALLPEAPTPGRIVEERSISTTGVIQWTLTNGSTFYLKPTDYREDEVLFAARSPGGTSLFDEDDHIAALTAAAVVQSGGVGELSVNELRKRLAGSLAGVGADIGSTYEGLSGAASSQDLETLFQLIHLKFTAPRVDA